MFTVRRLDAFTKWLESLKDNKTKMRLIRRLERAEKGNLGDVNDVGDGVSEMREHFGPGWRMYFVQRGKEVIVMLGGGAKSTQSSDIKEAKSIAGTLKD